MNENPKKKIMFGVFLVNINIKFKSLAYFVKNFGYGGFPN